MTGAWRIKMLGPQRHLWLVLPLLLLEPYGGAGKVKVCLVQKAWVAQRSDMICLKLWVLRSSTEGPSQAKKPTTKSQVRYVACWCQNKLICLIFFSFSINFLDFWEITIELKPGHSSDGKQTCHHPILAGLLSKPLMSWMLHHRR